MYSSYRLTFSGMVIVSILGYNYGMLLISDHRVFKQQVHSAVCFFVMCAAISVKYPQFLGSGYLAFTRLRGAYRQFTIEIVFRPDTNNGLLLFSANNPDASSDFFSVALIDGRPEFRSVKGLYPALY